MMQVNFVPETMPLQLMLQNFIKHRSNIAVVIDEFGGTAGVISLEDVLEQIFGEIEDEHDIPDLTEKQVGQDEYVLSCRLEVKYLNEKYGLGIEESKEYDTLAGFIIFNYDGIDRWGKRFSSAACSCAYCVRRVRVSSWRGSRNCRNFYIIIKAFSE